MIHLQNYGKSLACLICIALGSSFSTVSLATNGDNCLADGNKLVQCKPGQFVFVNPGACDWTINGNILYAGCPAKKPLESYALYDKRTSHPSFQCTNVNWVKVGKDYNCPLQVTYPVGPNFASNQLPYGATRCTKQTDKSLICDNSADTTKTQKIILACPVDYQVLLYSTQKITVYLCDY